MIQEIYCKAVLRFTDSPNVGEVAKSLKRTYPISKVGIYAPNSVLVELTCEYNAAYPRAKVKRWIYGYLLRLDVPNLGSVEILKLTEEAEIYGNI